MPRIRYLGMVVSLMLLIAQRQAGLAQSPAPAPSGAADELTCRVYRLSELGDDPSFGKWIAETIPEVIQPRSWNPSEPLGSRCKINYHAPSRILVVYHTAAVHAKVDAFLRDLKKALPQEGATAAAPARKMPAMDRRVVQAGAVSTTGGVNFSGQFTGTPASVQPSVPPAPPSGYPVAKPLKQPKHLFHFIIRYEGDGLIDANVVKFAKAMNSENSTRNDATAYAMPGSVSPPVTYQTPSPNANGSYGPPPAPSNVGTQSSAPVKPQIAPAARSKPAAPPPSEAPPRPR